MKKLLISAMFLSIVILVSGFISADDSCNVETSASCSNRGGNPLLEMYSTTNSHGALNGESSYSYVLCCDFGGGDTLCDGNNKVLGLSSLTNAHAEGPEYTAYGEDVCYENLICRSTTSSGNPGEMEIVSISGTTNAHIANFSGAGSYATKIYCSLGCEQWITKDDCWTQGTDCTWTPPWTTSNPEGGCCGANEEWNGIECIDSGPSICNVAIFWDPWNQIPGVGGNVFPESILSPTLINPWEQYCVSVTSDSSIGIKYDVRPYPYK